MNTDYYRGEIRGSSKLGAPSTYRDARGGSNRDRDFGYDREFDRAPKHYKDDRVYGDYAYGQTASRSERPSSSATGAAIQSGEYRTLCLSNLNPRIQDATIKEAINQEFKKFGDFNIKVVHTGPGDHRVAYVNFRYPEDASDAKYARAKKLFLFDMPTRIDAVFPKKQRGDSPDMAGGAPYSRDPYGSSGRSLSPVQGGRSGRHDLSSDSRDRDYGRNHDSRGPQDGQNKHHDHKFPHHLNHIKPEDDEKATRTLFVGNLDIMIMDDELRNHFERYGVVEDIDIKRPGKGQGNAYAFVKFGNLDMAHRAKVDMSGRYIGKLQCKIGYGKVNPTNCVWIGGLGPWINPNSLEAEFDRFGVINKIQWTEGKNYAYILFNSVDAAQFACKEVRGLPLGGPDRRLRVDFADPTIMGAPAMEKSTTVSKTDNWQNKGQQFNRGDKSDGFRKSDGRDDYLKPRRDDADGVNDTSDKWKNSRGGNYPEADQGYRTKSSNDYQRNYSPSRDRDGRTSPASKRQRVSGSQGYDRDYYNRDNGSANGNNYDRISRDSGLFASEQLQDALTVQDMAKSLPVVWSGALVLKTSAFSSRMHLVSGNVRLVDELMRDQTTTEMPFLKITQRLRLDQPKLDDMGRRVATSGPHGYSILLAMPGSDETLEDANVKVQHRPLKNLVSYLKQKEAAGVISLPPNARKEQELGVLHAFPPCRFGQEYLLKRAPRLGLELKEDHLIVIVVGGSA